VDFGSTHAGGAVKSCAPVDPGISNEISTDYDIAGHERPPGNDDGEFLPQSSFPDN
jgi:hypothetical protein